MTEKSRIGFESALLVNGYVITAAFIAALLAWWLGADSVAALLIAVAAVGLVSRLWGMYALNRLQVSVRCDSEVLSVGRSTVLRYTIENKKALPLVWLELCQDVPAQSCMSPENGFTLKTFSEDEQRYSGRKDAYMRRFAFLMGWHCVEWECQWTGRRRGVYRPGNLLLRAGDGFGLTQNTREQPGLEGKIFVVWPKIVEVDPTPFLRNIWSGRTGRAGWAEDPSVLRGERLYQPRDSWKHIDWRSAARTDELYVRQYETVLPQSLLFIFDSAALADPEEAISILASEILELTRRGIACGLVLPRSGSRPSQLLRPDDPAVSKEELLFALSDFDAQNAIAGGFDIAAVLSAAPEAGQLYMVCGSKAANAASPLAEALTQYGLRWLCENGSGALPLSALRTGGAP